MNIQITVFIKPISSTITTAYIYTHDRLELTFYELTVEIIEN